MNENEYKFTFKKAWLHLTTIIKHKHYVRQYCWRCGLIWRGIAHDMSKFSPKEFITNVKYTVKGDSPINVQKRVMGYSESWLHHKGRNRHHYEYWMDNFDKGGQSVRMPYEETVEMICDYLGANKAYNPKGYSFKSEWDWWVKKSCNCAMHPDNRAFLTLVFKEMQEAEESGMKRKDILKKYLDKKTLKEKYDRIIDGNKSKRMIPLKNIVMG